MDREPVGPHDKVNRPPGAYNREAHMDRRRELAQIWADILLADMPAADTLLDGKRK